MIINGVLLFDFLYQEKLSPDALDGNELRLDFVFVDAYRRAQRFKQLTFTSNFKGR